MHKYSLHSHRLLLGHDSLVQAVDSELGTVYGGHCPKHKTFSTAVYLLHPIYNTH